MNTFKRLMLVLVGVMLVGLGIAINLANNWGSDPATVFAHALSLKFNAKGWSFFTVGNVLILMNLIVFIVLTITDKFKYYNIGTFAGTFCIGIFSDMWFNIISDAVVNLNSLVFKIVWLLLGALILSTGIGLYVAGDMGASPIDLISVAISDHFKKLSYPIVRIVCDLIFAILGWILGGVIGLTTILCMVLIGPISGFVIKYAKKICKF